MNYLEQYNSWLEESFTDEETKKELRTLEGDNTEIEDRFYKDLEFGTGGMRGVIGAGTNRMNIYTIARATQGFADFLIEKFKENISVAIAYDSRNMSKEFSDKAAEVLSSNGIKVYLHNTLRSTPELSFAVRELKCNGGIVITASHNPPEYNGYKVYNEFGGQLLEGDAENVIDKISKLDFNSIKKDDNFRDNIEYIKEDTENKFIDVVKDVSLSDDLDFGISVVYTPLHGTGNIPVRRVLRERGFDNVFVVKEQELPDSNFSTVKYPNPEDLKAFELAIKTAKEVDGDLILATDPDCDRVGVMAIDDKTGEFALLNGNQTGAILVNYLLERASEKNALIDGSIIINTVVTSDLGEKIAADYGVKTKKTLTGFKYIGDKIDEFQKIVPNCYLCGYEESYGYLVGDHVRDKDAVSSSMLIVEMASYYKKRGLSLWAVLYSLYEKYGYHLEETQSISLEGISGQNKITKIIEYFRENKPAVICGLKINKLYDFKTGLSYDFVEGDFKKIDFPISNVLKFCFENGSWFSIRPSGTEPKMKIYYSSCEESEVRAKTQLEEIKNEVFAIIEKMI